jgi:hypothetical protein
MAKNSFSWLGFFLRLLFALILVYSSYNPSGTSFYHWAKEALLAEPLAVTPPLGLSAVVLLIGWTIYLRATFRSLGLFGLALAFAFFGIIVWWLIDSGLLGLENTEIVTYIALFILSAVLATGMSWSHIRRRLSGQADMDDIDE